MRTKRRVAFSVLGRGFRRRLFRLRGKRRRRGADAGPDMYLPEHHGQRFLRQAPGEPGQRADRDGTRARRPGRPPVRSQFTRTSSETTSVTLLFDNDIALNLRGIPTVPRRS